MKAQSYGLAAFLTVLVSTTVGFGLYHRHFYVVSAFAVWLVVEYCLWRFPSRWQRGARFLHSVRRVRAFSSLLDLYGKSDSVPEQVISERIWHLKNAGSLSAEELGWLERLRALLEIKNLISHKKPLNGKRELRRAFLYTRERFEWADAEAPEKIFWEVQDITEAAINTAELYWKLYDACINDHKELTRHARDLYQKLFGTEFQTEKARATLEKLTDSIQRDQGVPFLILNLIHQGRIKTAQLLTQNLLRDEEQLEDELRSTLYWICEIHLFCQPNAPVLTDFESTIRYLYHLCFTNPERAGFLEIDSQYFSQFDVVNELAKEGFLFKEEIVTKFISLWKGHESIFDDIYRSVLSATTGESSKIYTSAVLWEHYWARAHENFSQDYLHVVEGNLAFAKGFYQEARLHYEAALELSPRLRPALFNILFAYAKLGLPELHDKMAQKVLECSEYLPSSLSVIANSYLMIGDDAKAQAYADELRKIPGWRSKVEYYQSTFCFEHRLFEKALELAKYAHEQNPEDTRLSYHLSLCFSAVGDKEKALRMLDNVPNSSEWLQYYRFTLERDSGKHADATKTLLQIPPDYFEDPSELEEAIDFAKSAEDLALLRHLRKK